jgi:hypothetical protein
MEAENTIQIPSLTSCELISTEESLSDESNPVCFAGGFVILVLMTRAINWFFILKIVDWSLCTFIGMFIP